MRDKRCRCLFDDHTGIGAVPLSRAKASLERNRRTCAVSPTIFAARQRAAADDGQQRGRDSGDSLGDLGGECVDFEGQQPQVLNEPPRQPEHQAVVRCRCLGGPVTAVKALVRSDVGRWQPPGIEFVEMPAQSGDDPGALSDEIFAVIDQ